jgi:hypothetical protein
MSRVFTDLLSVYSSANSRLKSETQMTAQRYHLDMRYLFHAAPSALHSAPLCEAASTLMLYKIGICIGFRLSLEIDSNSHDEWTWTIYDSGYNVICIIENRENLTIHLPYPPLWIVCYPWWMVAAHIQHRDRSGMNSICNGPGCMVIISGAISYRLMGS